MQKNEKLKGHLLILTASILFSINIPVSKYLLPSHVAPEGLAMMRMSFSCIMFFLVSFFVKREKVSLKDLGLLFLCGFCGVALNQTLFVSGLSITSPVDASIIATIGPIFVMLLAAIILKEPITRMKFGGVMLGAIGGLSLVLSSAYSPENQSSSSLEGNLMIVFSSLSYSIYLVIQKPLSQRYSAVTIMKWMFFFATIIMLPFLYSHVLDAPVFHRGINDWKELGAVFFVLFFATFIPYLLIPMSLKRIRPTTVSMYNYIQPIVASFIAVMVGQDHFTIGKFLSAILVFSGVYLVTQSKSRADMEKEMDATSINSVKKSSTENEKN